MKVKIVQILNITGLLLTLVINYLANALPIAGKNTGEVSGLYETLFAPAEFTFAIWGIIYLLLLVFDVYQAKGLFKPAHPKRPPSYYHRIGYLFFISCLANAAWIFAWHYEVLWLSMVLMIVLLISLLQIYIRLGVGRRIVKQSERYFVHLPFSVYLGWISVATIANAATFLVSIQWDGFGIHAEIWTAIMILAAAAISTTMLIARKDLFFSLVILWAFFGIFVKRITTDPQQSLVILLALAFGAFIILAVIIFQSVKKFIRKLS
jgi:hypothetical protein